MMNILHDVKDNCIMYEHKIAQKHYFPNKYIKNFIEIHKNIKFCIYLLTFKLRIYFILSFIHFKNRLNHLSYLIYLLV